MKFSVLICVYKGDNADYFVDAYESILHQKKLPNQIVIVVDGNISSLLDEYIRDFKERACKINVEFDVVRLSTNMGHGYARMEGVLACKYDLIALADADDINHRDRFYIQTAYLKMNPSISVLGSQIIEVEHDTLLPISKKIVPLNNNDIKTFIKYRCPFNQMSVMFKKKDVMLAGNYKSFFHNEDYYLWIRMYLMNCLFSNLPEYLVNARVNKNFYNRRGGYKYFLSEYRLQKYMLNNKVITLPTWFLNVSIRFTVQVLLPDSVRGLVFKYIFRKGTNI